MFANRMFLIRALLGIKSLVESDGVKFTNVTVLPTEGAAFILKNVKNFTAKDLKYPAGLQQPFEINGVKTKNIVLPLTTENKNLVLRSEKIDSKEIIFLK